jgi:hypothetical protein
MTYVIRMYLNVNQSTFQMKMRLIADLAPKNKRLKIAYKKK